MAKPNFYEDVQKGVLDEVTALSRNIAEEFKGTKEYEKPEVSDAELYFNFVQLEEQEKMVLAQKYGELWLDFLHQMKKFEERLNA